MPTLTAPQRSQTETTRTNPYTQASLITPSIPRIANLRITARISCSIGAIPLDYVYLAMLSSRMGEEINGD